MGMTISDLDGGVTKIALAGRMDTTGAGEVELQFSVASGARRKIVVDLSAVEIMTSLAVRILLMGARTVKSKGGKMALYAPVPTVATVLTMAGVDQLIPLCADEAAAVALVVD
ncbi:MAG: STAS domain-containing protein [Labrys sp. (in: a-proteobacteria)]|jgi:anti-sigma B factor antagonist